MYHCSRIVCGISVFSELRLKPQLFLSLKVHGSYGCAKTSGNQLI